MSTIPSICTPSIHTPQVVQSAFPTIPVFELLRLRASPPTHSVRHQFCDHLRHHGYAAIAVDDGTYKELQAAYVAADEFFRIASAATKMKCRVLVPEVGDHKGLLGYNQPHAGKELYRFRRGPCCRRQTSDLEAITRADSCMADGLPWIVESIELRNALQAILRVFDFLEDVADSCLRIVCLDLGLSYDAIKQYAGDAHLHHQSYSASPFDMFHYFNHPPATAVSSNSSTGAVATAIPPNCNIHVDPGFLTVVPCAPVAGLAVFDPALDEWVAVEHQLGLQPLRHLIVFPGRTLETLSRRVYAGTWHQVVRNDRPRLSLVYEVRPRASFEFKMCRKPVAHGTSAGDTPGQTGVPADEIELPENCYLSFVGCTAMQCGKDDSAS